MLIRVLPEEPFFSYLYSIATSSTSANLGTFEGLDYLTEMWHRLALYSEVSEPENATESSQLRLPNPR
jgi:hypothetical protein